MAGVEPAVLRWARETAGLSLEEAARAIELNAARGHSAAERMIALESGEDEPSRPLLLRMSKAYRRPLVAFYLAEPPKTGDRGQDFRTLPDRQRYSAELDALVRDIKARQGLIRSMLEDNDAGPLAFVDSMTLSKPAEELAGIITEHLGFSLEAFRARKSIDEAFAYVREQIEDVGVFVLLLGNLGSYHTNIPVEVFRGFALADRLAPMIIINDLDARSAWSFTAFHELAHLWLGATGLSGANDTKNKIEQYCNDVAGEILLPKGELDSLAELRSTNALETTAEIISAFATERRLSRSMVAYKLLRNDFINWRQWSSLTAHFADQWAKQKQREAEENKELEGGPSYYVVRRHRVGKALLGLVRRSLDDGTITYTKAGRVLGVKPRSVEPLLANMRGAR